MRYRIDIQAVDCIGVCSEGSKDVAYRTKENWCQCLWIPPRGGSPMLTCLAIEDSDGAVVVRSENDREFGM